MPIYEYRCKACGHEFEKIMRYGAEHPPCPQCSEPTDKKMSLSAFHLKGGGWYSDAYAGSDNKGPADTTAKAPKSSSGSSGSDSGSSSSSSSSSDSSSSSSSSASSTSGSSSSSSTSGSDGG